jgi:hypothetical protein
MSKIKIEKEEYDTIECSIQLSSGKWCNIYLLLDIAKYPIYYKDFIDFYENRKIFNIDSDKLRALNCIIKTVDIEFGRTIGLNIRCEDIITDLTSIRRDELITSILKDN